MVSELLTIADRTEISPAIDSEVFPNTPPEPFWSYSGDAGYGGGDYWVVMFSTGASAARIYDDLYRVRCVKEGPGYGDGP